MTYTPSAPTYCQVSDVTTALRITDTVDDDTIGLAVDAAARLIEQELGRRFWDDTIVTTHSYKTSTPFLLETHDFADVTDLVITTYPFGVNELSGAITWGIGDYQLEPLDGVDASGTPWPYERIRAVRTLLFPVYGGIAYPLPYQEALTTVTTKFGFGYIPPTIVQANIIQAIALWKSPDVPFGATAFGEVGVVKMTQALHPSAKMLIRNYYKTEVWVA